MAPMRLRCALTLALLAAARGCPHGEAECPQGSPSAGICVPASPAGNRSCQDEVWHNVFAPANTRATSLLKALRLDEKLALMTTAVLPGQANYVPRLGIIPPATTECLHGVCRTNYTVFPQSVSLAATFDAGLLERVGRAIGTEMRATSNDEARLKPLQERGLPICLGPQINIARDPRWGRAQETYGEDPFLTGSLAVAYVSGMRGNDSRVQLAGAVVKHFNAYNGQTSRGSYSVSEVTLSYEDWMDTYLPHWAAVMTATPVGVMCSYNSLCLVNSYNESCPPPSHGVPACADPSLLQEVLRDQWQFDGFVMSDAGAIQFLETDHRYAQSQTEAASLALKAGCDLDLGGGESAGQCRSFSCLSQSLGRGMVDEADLDRALLRQIRARVLTGTLDPPEHQVYGHLSVASDVDTPSHRALALEAAHKSVVLLKNSGCLPLNNISMSLPGEMAVVGPNADKELFGNYNGRNRAVTILDGLREYMPLLSYHYGVNMTSPPDQGDVMAAVAAAANAEVTVAVMGLDQTQEYEGGTRSDIVLPGWQSQLLDELRVHAKTLVVVLVGGSAIAVPWVQRNADAALWVGYGGQAAGTALADVLFGAVSPSGKLPMTWYTGLEQLPPFASMDMRASPGRTYRYLTEKPLYSFGFGLSYARFNLTIGAPQAPSVGRCHSFTFPVTLRHNGGAPLAQEVVQVYVLRHELAAPRRLAAFARSRAMNASQEQALSLSLPAASLLVQEGKLSLWEPGPVTVRVSLRGPEDPEARSFTLTLSGERGPCGTSEALGDNLESSVLI